MAEITLLRQSAIVRNASVGTSPPSPPRGPLKMGELPLVQVKMGPGGPQVLTPQQRPVEILAPRDADSATRVGGLPMVHVKMTSQGAQLDDGQDKPVVILPPKDQRRTGGVPMTQMRRAQAAAPVQTLPHVQGAPPQIQGPQPAVSQLRGQPRIVRIAAPKQVAPTLPSVEFPADQLMLCRYLVGKYLADLCGAPLTASADVDLLAAPGATEITASTDVTSIAEDPATILKKGNGSENKAVNVSLAEATIDTIDQALAAEAAAVQGTLEVVVEETLEAVVEEEVPLQAPAVSIIPAAPTASYVAGRVGDRPHGYAGGRVQRNAAMAPRRVARPGVPGALPPVIVKMENGRSVVQNKEEVAAVRAAVAAAAAGTPADGSVQD